MLNMFLKGKAVPWWCGVDVTEENGLVRRGTICRKAPGGLFVDFRYPGHDEHFVPLDRCANHRVLDGVDDYRIGSAVEAPDQPWRWYPAKYLAEAGSELERDWFAFVAVNIGETVVEKVLPKDAVRSADALKLSGSAVLSHYFEHDFEMPQSGELEKLSGLIAKVTVAGFLKIWNRETCMVGMKLERGRVFYSWKSEHPFMAQAVENALNRIANKYSYLCSEAVSSVTVDDGAGYPDSQDIDQLDLMDDPITAHLSLNIMHEIFSFLSPVQQVPCRKVCSLWNTLLTSGARTCRVEIDIATLDCFQLAARLHGAISGSTKILVLSGGSKMRTVTHSSLYEHVRTVKTMLKTMNLRIRFIIISGAAVLATDLLDSWYSVDCDILHHSKWRDVCDTLILRNVTVALPFGMTVSVMVKKEVLDVQVDVGVENVLENWCPEISEPEMEELDRKLRLLWGCKNDHSRMYLWTLLVHNQPADPRFTPYDLPDLFPLPAGTPGAPALASLRKLTVWALTGPVCVPNALQKASLKIVIFYLLSLSTTFSLSVRQ